MIGFTVVGKPAATPITSSPFLIALFPSLGLVRVENATRLADDPELTVRTCLTPKYFANFCSNKVLKTACRKPTVQGRLDHQLQFLSSYNFTRYRHGRLTWHKWFLVHKAISAYFLTRPLISDRRKSNSCCLEPVVIKLHLSHYIHVFEKYTLRAYLDSLSKHGANHLSYLKLCLATILAASPIVVLPLICPVSKNLLHEAVRLIAILSW